MRGICASGTPSMDNQAKMMMSLFVLWALACSVTALSIGHIDCPWRTLNLRPGQLATTGPGALKSDYTYLLNDAGEYVLQDEVCNGCCWVAAFRLI